MFGEEASGVDRAQDAVWGNISNQIVNTNLNP